MPRWVLLLLPAALLLLLPALGMDGCGGGREWRCGDACISPNSWCLCGNSTFGWSSGQWCCGTGCVPGQERDRYGSVKGATCPAGTAVSLTQSCAGTCNYHGTDRNRHVRRSYIGACTNSSICVKEVELCLSFMEQYTAPSTTSIPSRFLLRRIFGRHSQMWSL